MLMPASASQRITLVACAGGQVGFVVADGHRGSFRRMANRERCSLIRVARLHRRNSRAVISFCVTLAAWASGRRPARRSRRRSSSSADAIWSPRVRPGCRCGPIARDLGMVSSAVYRYVASRDDLLTLLLVDAYSELADAVDRAACGGGRAVARPTARNGACGPRVGGRSAGPLGAAIRQPGARLSRAAGAHCRSGHPGRRRAIRRNRVRNCSRAEISAEQCCCGPTVVVGLRPAARGVRVRRRRLRGGEVLLLWAGLVGAISLEVFGQYGADTLTEPGSRVRHPGPAADRDADRLAGAHGAMSARRKNYPGLTRHR